MRLKKYITELSMKHARIEVESSTKTHFKTTIYAEVPDKKERIFTDWLFMFQADLIHDSDKIVHGFAPHMSKKTMIEILDKHIPEWKKETIGALKAVHFGFDPSFIDVEKEAVTEWKYFAAKKLKEEKIRGIWELSFQDEMGNVNISPKEKGVAIQVFAGIEKSVKLFAKKYDPSVIVYESPSEEKSKVKLYKTLAEKIKRHGYVELNKSLLTLLTGPGQVAWGFIKKDKEKIFKEIFGI